MYDTATSPLIGQTHPRARFAFGSALSGTLALLAFAAPGTALAANECGLAPLVAGSVTCTPAGNPYATGITYIAPPADLTIVLQDGVRVDTTGLPQIGVDAGGTTALTVNGGVNTAITTSGIGAHGAQIVTIAAPLSVTLDQVSTSGINAIGVLASSATGNVSVRANRIVTTGDGSTGILAQTGGAVDVNSSSISTSGANAGGIVAAGATGVTVINGSAITTAGLASNGVDASSTTGPVAVTVRDVTTSGNGSKAVVLNAAAGNATATVNGALRTTGTAADALTVNSGANSVVNIGSGASFSTVQGDYIKLSSVGTSTLNTAATIGNNPGGFALVATGGPIRINNTGNLSSDIVLTSGADVVNNSGTFTVGANPDFGAGVDSFTNSGLITLRPGAMAVVSPVFTGLESLTNSGTIDLRNARAGDTLTVPGTYAGANGTLGLDISSNGTTTVADRLVIGGAATGTTTIELNQLSGSDPAFNPGTILVTSGAGTSATAFGLADGGYDAGFVRYEVDYDAASNTFVLTGAPSDTAFRTLNHAEGIRSLWLKSADAVSGQMRARRDTMWSVGGGDTAGRFWMQMHGSKETREGQRNFNAYGQSRLTNTGYEQDFFGGQIGLDISGSSSERGGFAFGVTGGYLNSSIGYGGTADRVDFDVANAGVYASYSAGNLFFNALGKYDRYWAKASTPSAAYRQKFSGDVYGGRAEVGLRFGSDSFFIEPAASISYIRNEADDLTPLGTNIAFDEDEGLRGRFGGRIGGLVDIGGPKLALYAGANYVHEFKGRDKVAFTSGGQTLIYTNNRLRDYGEATVGTTIAQGEVVSGFFEGNYIRSFSGKNGQRGIDGIGGRAGIRFKF